MVEAKRIERQEQKIRELFGSEDESEFDDEGDKDDDGRNKDHDDFVKGTAGAHLIPQIIVTNNQGEIKENLYQRHTKQNYAKLSRKLLATDQRYENMEDECKDDGAADVVTDELPKAKERNNTSSETSTMKLDRKNWKNKEYKVKSGKLSSTPTSKTTVVPPTTTTTTTKKKEEIKIGWVKDEAGLIKSNQDVASSFSKSYSFKNLPKGRVALLQRQFEQTNSEQTLHEKNTDGHGGAIPPLPPPPPPPKTRSSRLSSVAVPHYPPKPRLGTTMIKKTVLEANDRPNAEAANTSAPPFFKIRTWDESRTNRISSNYYEDVFIQKSSSYGEGGGSCSRRRSAAMLHSSNPSLNHDESIASSSLRPSMSEENLQDYGSSGCYRRRNVEDPPETDGVIIDRQRDINSSSSKARQRSSEWFTYHDHHHLNKQPLSWQPPLDHDSLRHCHPHSQQKFTRETYYAFENLDCSGQVLSWTEIVTIQSVHDCSFSISEAIYV